jgi:hypothetical protein
MTLIAFKFDSDQGIIPDILLRAISNNADFQGNKILRNVRKSLSTYTWASRAYPGRPFLLQDLCRLLSTLQKTPQIYVSVRYKNNLNLPTFCCHIPVLQTGSILP